MRPPGCFPDAAGAEADRLLARLGVAGDAEVVGLCPGAAFGASKLWPNERFAAVGDRLARERGARVLIFHGPGEEAQAAEGAEGKSRRRRRRTRHAPCYRGRGGGTGPDGRRRRGQRRPRPRTSGPFRGETRALSLVKLRPFVSDSLWITCLRANF